MDINELNEIIDGAIHNVKRMGQHGRFGLSLRTLEAIKGHIAIEQEEVIDPLAEPVVCPNCFWINPKPTSVVIVHNSGEKFAVPTHVTDLREFKSGPYVEDPSSSTACTLYPIKGAVR